MSQQRATAWSVTINNPTSQDYEEINLARQKGWTVEGQVERGAEGTPHLQLMVKTPQVRFSAVKKAFARSHIEAARNVAALATYVAKEETRESPLPTTSDKYPSLSKFWDLIYQTMIEWNWLDMSEGYPCGWWKDAPPKRDALAMFDTAVGALIEAGYYVEGIGSNPSTRSAWNKWKWQILRRSYQNACKQTDRQTDSECVQSAEVNIPVYTHNDAGYDCDDQGSSYPGERSQDAESSSSEGAGCN